jgi:hypothetical protein
LNYDPNSKINFNNSITFLRHTFKANYFDALKMTSTIIPLILPFVSGDQGYIEYIDCEYLKRSDAVPGKSISKIKPRNNKITSQQIHPVNKKDKVDDIENSGNSLC